tara:strand:- start:11035 stop:11385 length:351 start_codon:yes stop_codon:yes gene_type:complete
MDNDSETLAEFNLPTRLSMSDIATLDVCKGGGCSDLPFDQLLDIAYQHGLNVKKHYKIKKGLHRNLKGKVVECEYIIAEERMDKKWIRSGNASLEATIASSKDGSLRKELNNLRGK